MTISVVVNFLRVASVCVELFAITATGGLGISAMIQLLFGGLLNIWRPIVPEELIEVYDSERKALSDLRSKLSVRHARRGVLGLTNEEDMKAAFTIEAKNRYAEAGFVVEVDWEWEDEEKGQRSPDISDDPNDQNLYWIPRIVIVGRTEKIAGGQYDHDKQKHEVRSGLLDGKVGEIREDGSFREDFRKKSY